MNKKKKLFFILREEGLALYLAWALALGGFCISVFFGEILQHEPCPLCWYQRIALFPLAIILGIAAYRNDRGIVSYTLPLAILGGMTALFQILQIHFPILQETGICSLGESCSETVFTLFGFLDLPTLSAIGFILIAALLWIARKRSAQSPSE